MLCWKVLLSTLGGIDVLRETKARKRQESSLEPIEDTLQAAIHMKPLTQSFGTTLVGGTGSTNTENAVNKEALQSFLYFLNNF